MVKSSDLMELTSKQLKTIIDSIKKKLNLGVSGKNKEELVQTIMTLHKGNKYFGKKLLSFDDSGHIKVPQRKIAPMDMAKLKRKQEKMRKEAEAKRKEEERTPEGRLKKLMSDLKSANSEAEIAVIRAKIRKLRKDISK
jgi:hypothetical protein